MIRAKLFKGLGVGTMSIGSLYDDQREALIAAPACSYCGTAGLLSIDHLVPRAAGGVDADLNLIRACRSCNSSKGKRDLLGWYQSRNAFPPLLLVRRYLKLMHGYVHSHGLANHDVSEGPPCGHPFDFAQLPLRIPPLAQLRL